MINFIDTSQEKPYKEFIKYYDLARKNNQNIIEAMSISSYSKENCEVNSRYVNLKYIKGKEWIFFSNYNSPKSNEFRVASLFKHLLTFVFFESQHASAQHPF